MTPSSTSAPSTVLFLCSGNYYRSRFAEILFNDRGQNLTAPWTAISRGLIVDRIRSNIGPISPYTKERLAALGIPLPFRPRFPVQLHESELAAANLVIALKETEHRDMLTERFPNWPNRVEYWHIDDLDYASATTALPSIEDKVTQLMERLARSRTVI